MASESIDGAAICAIRLGGANEITGLLWVAQRPATARLRALINYTVPALRAILARIEASLGPAL